MPIIKTHVKSDRTMTGQEEQYALMCCAKMLQAATVVSASAKCDSDVVERLSLETSALLCSVVDLYGNDGKRMEREALALAQLLGFDIEQHYIGQPAGGVN